MAIDRTSLIDHGIEAANFDAEAEVAFPRLSDQQTQRIAAIARVRTRADGEPLWRVGDREASLFVIIEGAVEIRQPLPGGDTRLIVSHGPSGFTGDVDLLSSKAAVVSGIAKGSTRVFEVCPVTLKKLVVSDPEISDLILAAFMARRRLLLAQKHGEITLIGSRFSPKMYLLREFLERNARPFTWIDVETDPGARQLIESLELSVEETPAVVTTAGEVCRNPSVAGLANELGLSNIGTGEIYDMAVVGGGPAGLAAAVYGGSEGLDTIVLDARAPGGQAGTSSKIENYLGFPMGISGADLAQNALMQAEKFGVRFATPRRVSGLFKDGPLFRLELDNGEQLRARAVVAASGVHYRRLPAENAERFEGRGIYFAATRMEAELCTQEEVAIVGGGNSAGQAAVYLAKSARRVHILIRSGDLNHSMSRYLINRIDALANVQLHAYTEIRRFIGTDRLERIEIQDNRREVTSELPVSNVFVFIGAVANTDWLQGVADLDQNGFVHTGDSLDDQQYNEGQWRPFLFETRTRGLFAVGDLRRDSTKRVASAVGEGSIVVQFVHRRVAGA
ncbi:MAG: FAD-dependent oxidoreductase [Thiohalocapsa sp.]